jgi:hypothetical protein
MLNQSEAVLSAYVDGEPVEPGAVLEALDSEEGRLALADFVRLRLITAAHGTPSPEFYARMRDAVPVIAPRTRRPPAWTMGAALAASLAFGFWIGSAVASRNAVPSGSVALGGPPKAARVIELLPGVDWHQPSEEVAR